MISFNPNYFLRALSPNIVTLGAKASTYESGGQGNNSAHGHYNLNIGDCDHGFLSVQSSLEAIPDTLSHLSNNRPSLTALLHKENLSFISKTLSWDYLADITGTSWKRINLDFPKFPHPHFHIPEVSITPKNAHWLTRVCFFRAAGFQDVSLFVNGKPRFYQTCHSFKASSKPISFLTLFLTVLPRTGLSHLQGSEPIIL